jgi:hypothetical protein
MKGGTDKKRGSKKEDGYQRNLSYERRKDRIIQKKVHQVPTTARSFNQVSLVLNVTRFTVKIVTQNLL